ncbi:MAG: hypothetical protein JWN49_517, partial [Parcubacteria group bacterium]|nr:hypothetical protein [Parcubacteria group bacterium]MDB5245023.1 hypothetical protein [Parcubacteria group bacterium]
MLTAIPAHTPILANKTVASAKGLLSPFYAS